MKILITDNPGMNSYLTSLIEEYESEGHEVLCGFHNFFYSNYFPDILHIQWPEKIYSWYPFSTYSNSKKIEIIEKRLNYYKLNNVIVVHTIHNIKPHVPEDIDFEIKIFELIIKYSEIICHHCQQSISILSEYYPNILTKKNIITPHGDYLIDFLKIDKCEARKKIGIPQNKFVLLNFGHQIKYKNKEFLEGIFNNLKIKNKYLLTAGNYRLGGYGKLQRIFQIMKRNWKMKRKFSNKKYYLKIISPEMLPYFICSADMLFVSHSGSLNSGILSLAATYSKPIVYPEIGCFSEQLRAWVGKKSYKPENKDHALQVIEEFYHEINNPSLNLDNTSWLNENSWKKHVNTIINNVKNINNE